MVIVSVLIFLAGSEAVPSMMAVPSHQPCNPPDRPRRGLPFSSSHRLEVSTDSETFSPLPKVTQLIHSRGKVMKARVCSQAGTVFTYPDVLDTVGSGGNGPSRTLLLACLAQREGSVLLGRESCFHS